MATEIEIAAVRLAEQRFDAAIEQAKQIRETAWLIRNEHETSDTDRQLHHSLIAKADEIEKAANAHWPAKWVDHPGYAAYIEQQQKAMDDFMQPFTDAIEG